MSKVVTSWPVFSLFDFCNPKQWPTIPQSAFVEHGYAVYGANGKIGHYSEFNHAKPTVLITCRGATCGTINVCEPKSYVTGNAMALDDLDESMVSAEYLVYALRNGSLAQAISGTAQPQITRQSLTAISIPLPPLAQQRRIAEILDKADALRAKRRAALAQLDTLTQSIFLNMFGDVCKNPRAWPVRRVSEFVAEFQGGKSLEADSDENAQTRNRVLKISAVTGMTFLANECKPVPNGYEPPVEHFVRPGDLLFSRANTTELVGAVAYVQSTPKNLLLPDKLWRFVWREPAMVQPLFVWALFQTPAVRREIERRATGTSGSMKNISQQKVFGILTIWPPIAIQEEFARRLAAVEQVRIAYRASHEKFDALFASLQHRAFRGDL